MRVSYNRFATSVIPRAMLKLANPIGKVVSVSLVRLIARPMLASAYIANGIVRVKNPDVAASSVEPISKIAKKKFDVEIDPALIARATGVAQVTAGSLLAIGKMPRLSSSILVTTYLLEVVGQQLNKETRSPMACWQRPQSLVVRFSHQSTPQVSLVSHGAHSTRRKTCGAKSNAPRRRLSTQFPLTDSGGKPHSLARSACNCTGAGHL